MENNHIVIVICDGKITNVFSNEHVDLEVIDFDSVSGNHYLEGEMMDYIKECQKKMSHEIVFD